MVGNRLKLLRQANGLSLQELSDLLVGSELSLKRGALSHYELGITQPTDTALAVLARKLGTTTGFFEQPDWEEADFFFFRPLAMTGKNLLTLVSYLQIELEKILHIDKLLGMHKAAPLPDKRRIDVENEAGVEDLACRFREEYGVGSMPISSVCAMLESNGWRIIELTDAFDKLCLAGYEYSTQSRYILHPSLYVLDDFRYTLLSEVGYAYLEGNDAQQTDALTDRFARSVLFPKDLIIEEFGNKRDTVSIAELTLMKQKYGISKRTIMKRLEELGIIEQEYFNSFEDLMRLHGFPKRKKISSETLLFYENSVSPAMRVLQAQSKGLITQEEADNLILLKHI